MDVCDFDNTLILKRISILVYKYSLFYKPFRYSFGRNQSIAHHNTQIHQMLSANKQCTQSSSERGTRGFPVSA